MIKCAILILFFGNLSMKKFIILAFALISFGAASTIKSITFNGFLAFGLMVSLSNITPHLI